MSFLQSFDKVAFDEGEEVSPKKALIGGAALGGLYHVGRNISYEQKEKQLPNAKTVKQLKKSLQPGDILISGSHARGSGHIQVRDLGKSKLRKLFKAVGMKDSTRLYSNSGLLTAVGGGGKYHAGVYMGRGRVAHMTSNEGITTDSLKDFAYQQNIGAYRFGGEGKERQAALKFVKDSLKAKTQYQPFGEYAFQGISNALSPVGRKPCRKVGKGMVCNTLPVRAYSRRDFGPQGEFTYSSDIRAAKGIKPVARMDRTKLPLTTKGLIHGGQLLKGLKWGGAAAAGAIAYNKLFGSKDD